MKRICKTTELTCGNQQQELQMLRQHQHALIPESRAVAKLRQEFGSTNNANKATIVELQRQLREQKLQCDRLEEDKAQAQKRLAEIETTYRGIGIAMILCVFYSNAIARSFPRRTGGEHQPCQTHRSHTANGQGAHCGHPASACRNAASAHPSVCRSEGARSARNAGFGENPRGAPGGRCGDSRAQFCTPARTGRQR